MFFAEVLVAHEKLHRLAETVEVLHQAMADVPFAPVAVLNAAADRLGARRFQLVAGNQQFVPGLGRVFRVEAGLLEKHLVVAPEHRQRIPAEAIGIAAEVAQNRGVRGLHHIVLDEAVHRPHIAEPHAFHVVDAVPQILDIGRVARRRRGLELRDHHGGVLQHGLDLGIVIGGNRTVDEFLQAWQFLLAPPPHFEGLFLGQRGARTA